MITSKITIVNSNPHSKNAVRLGNGRGGRVISRDHYNVYDSEPPFPFSYQLWIIDDLQTERQHINVSGDRASPGERLADSLSSEGGKLYCQACDTNHCEHIKAVVVFEEQKEKSIAAHAAKAKRFIDDLQMRFAPLEARAGGLLTERELILIHLRVYANRFQVDFIDLAREYEK